MLSLEDGKVLVKAARDTVVEFLEKRSLEPEKLKNRKLNEKRGIFVTIKTFPSRKLRGCIGFVSPVQLYEGVQEAALSAAFKDPRFPRLGKKELNNIIFEVSVMSEPMLVSGKNLDELKEDIEIEVDGLIISNGPYSGLLLPQVSIEQKWDIDEFLSNMCYKAGMTPEFLDDENTKLWKFQCQIFSECRPDGEIEEIKLG